MYLQYFGLSESPFSSTPDRRFVYLSDRHREGLSHLLYGLREQIQRRLATVLGINVAVRLAEPKSIERSVGKAKRVIDKRLR